MSSPHARSRPGWSWTRRDRSALASSKLPRSTCASARSSVATQRSSLSRAASPRRSSRPATSAYAGPRQSASASGQLVHRRRRVPRSQSAPAFHGPPLERNSVDRFRVYSEPIPTRRRLDELPIERGERRGGERRGSESPSWPWAGVSRPRVPRRWHRTSRRARPDFRGTRGGGGVASCDVELAAVVLDDQGSQDEHANGGQVAAAPSG